MTFTKRQFMMALAAGGGALFLLVFLILYVPLISELRAKGHQCAAVEKEVAEARQTLGKMGQEDLRKTLITEREISAAIDEMTKSGKHHGLNFISLSPRHSEEIDNPRYKILPVEMEIEASFQALGEFLGFFDEMEKSFVTVESFNIQPDSKNPAKLRARLKVHLVFLR